MILEGIVTTVSPEGQINIAPMGPRVDAAMRRLLLRPFPTAQTCRNLREHGEGVLHVTDDVLLLARAAVGALDPVPPLVPAARVRGWVLTGACRYYEFRVTGTVGKTIAIESTADFTSILSNTRARCTSTVRTLMSSWSAISLLGRPSITSFMTSRSRSVSSARRAWTWLFSWRAASTSADFFSACSTKRCKSGTIRIMADA